MKTQLEKRLDKSVPTPSHNSHGSAAASFDQDQRPHALQLKSAQEKANQYSQNASSRFEDNRPQASVVQAKKNNTGLPDNLKSGIENLSGHSMDDVKVHYNSAKPAQLQAHAYAQGNQIHLAPGQEKHLPHEAWHVVQQKQGRVKPTMQLKGKVNVNDDAGLEREADVMGAKAMQMKFQTTNLSDEYMNGKPNSIVQRVSKLVKASAAIGGIFIGAYVIYDLYQKHKLKQMRLAFENSLRNSEQPTLDLADARRIYQNDPEAIKQFDLAWANVFPGAIGAPQIHIKDGKGIHDGTNFELNVKNVRIFTNTSEYETAFLKNRGQVKESVQNAVIGANLKPKTKHSNWGRTQAPADAHSIPLNNIVKFVGADPVNKNEHIAKFLIGQVTAQQLFLYQSNIAPQQVCPRSGFAIVYHTQAFDGMGQPIVPVNDEVIVPANAPSYMILTISEGPANTAANGHNAGPGFGANYRYRWRISRKPGPHVDWDIQSI